LKRSSCLCCDLESEHRCFHEARGTLDIDIRPDFVCRLRVPQPLDQSLVLRATALGAQCCQVGVGVSNSQMEPTPMQPLSRVDLSEAMMPITSASIPASGEAVDRSRLMFSATLSR